MSELAVIRTNNYLGMTDAMTAAKAMAASGYFADVKEANQALVKILAGQEMGFGAFASMTGVYIIQGRPSIGANLMAAAVKRSGKYDYRVLEMTDTVCELLFLQNGKEIGRSRFDLNDAKKAGTKNLDKFPRNMLFARAMSNGVKWFTPDIFNGAPVYTPEELGADTDQDGNVIDVPVTPPPAPPAAHTPAPAPEPKPWSEMSQETRDELARMRAEAKAGATMSLETAMTAKDSKDHFYHEVDSEKLSFVATSLRKSLAINGLSQEEHDSKQFKLDAILAILASRQAA